MDRANRVTVGTQPLNDPDQATHSPGFTWTYGAGMVAAIADIESRLIPGAEDDDESGALVVVGVREQRTTHGGAATAALPGWWWNYGPWVV